MKYWKQRFSKKNYAGVSYVNKSELFLKWRIGNIKTLRLQSGICLGTVACRYDVIFVKCFVFLNLSWT